MEAPKLRRGPFGYTSRSVRLVLADRDGLLAETSERAGAAEAQVLDVRSEAETSKTQLAEQAEQLGALGAEAAVNFIGRHVEESEAFPSLHAKLGPIAPCSLEKNMRPDNIRPDEIRGTRY